MMSRGPGMGCRAAQVEVFHWRRDRARYEGRLVVADWRIVINIIVVVIIIIHVERPT